MRLKIIMSPAQPTRAKAAASFVAIAAAGLFTCAVGAAAWAQTPPSAQDDVPGGAGSTVAAWVSNLVRPGFFAPVDSGVVFHIREKRGDKQVGGVFIDDSRNPDEYITIVAEYGQIVQNGDSIFMVLHSGFVERRRTKERDPAVVEFDQYAFDLTRITPARGLSGTSSPKSGPD
jgi:hypothetical protein